MDASQVPIAPMANSVDAKAIAHAAMRQAVSQTAWKWIVRFAFHLFVLYLILRFSRDELPVWLCSKWVVAVRGAAANTNPMKLYFP
jgi:hypothetical protein